MRLVSNVVTKLHLQTGTEQLAVRHGGRGVPHLDDMKLTLWRDRDTGNAFIRTLEEGVR